MPPPLPRQGPPPLSVGGPPPLPGRSPPPLPWERPDDVSFDPNATIRSDRDIGRIGGYTYGVWVSANSTNVNRFRYDPYRDLKGNLTGSGIITIEFLDLSMYEYPDRPGLDYLDLFQSSSKGRFVYYEVRRDWKFIKLRGSQRKVTATMRAARAPVTKRQKQRTFKLGGVTVRP